MLNLSGCDEDEAILLSQSFQALARWSSPEIVTNEPESNWILREILNMVSVPRKATLSIQNLIKCSIAKGDFYIAQVLNDFGYPESTKSGTNWTHKYHFQIIGIACASIELGRTMIRPKTSVEKRMRRVISRSDQRLADTDFDKKYQEVKDLNETGCPFLTPGYKAVLTKHSGIHIMTSGRMKFIIFENELTSNQSVIIAELLTNFKYLTFLGK